MQTPKIILNIILFQLRLTPNFACLLLQTKTITVKSPGAILEIVFKKETKQQQAPTRSSDENRTLKVDGRGEETQAKRKIK